MNAVLNNKLGLSELNQMTLYQAKGCPVCRGQGYKGRVALFETFWITDKIKQLIQSEADDFELERNAESYLTLKDDGISKLKQGLTSVAELQKAGVL